MSVAPRTFKLFDELEKGEKGQLSDPSCSYGLTDGNDQTFTNWNGTIVGPPNTKFDGRIYFLTFVCGPNYPDTPPVVKFTSKVNMTCVEGDGTVKFQKNATLKNWSASGSME